MESISNSGFSVDMRTSPSTNSGEGEQFNNEKKQVPSSSSFSSELKSPDQFDLMPNATTTTTHPRPFGATSLTRDQTYSQSELHNTHLVAEKGDGRPIDSHVEAHSSNPFGEANPSPLENNTAPSSSSQNPLLVMSDATTNTKHVGASESEKKHDHLHSFPAMQQEKGGMTNNRGSAFPADGMLGLHSSLALSTNESSQGNPFKVPPASETRKNTNVGEADLVKVDEQHHGNESHHRLPSPEEGHWSVPSSEAWTHPTYRHGETHVPSSSQQLDPLFTLESAQNQQQADPTSKNHGGAATIPISVEPHHRGATTIPISVEPHHTFSVTEQGHHSKASSNSVTDNKSGTSVPSFSPASESSTQDHMHNSANAATNTHGETHVPSSSQQLDPLFTLESAQNQQQADPTSKNHGGATTIPTNVEPHHTFSVTEQGHHSKASRNSVTDNKSGSPMSSFSPDSESSTQDHMHNSATAATNTHGETNVPSSSQQLDPLFTLESAQNQQQADPTFKNSGGATTIPTSVEPHHIFLVTEQGHHSKGSSNSVTDNKSGSLVSSFSPTSESSTQDYMHNSTNAATKVPQKRGKDVKFASEFTNDDIPISSYPKHGQGSYGAGQYSSAGVAPGTSNGSEKQNPPLQVMESLENPTTSSNYRFPSHVFDRHKSKSNTQWSTASNESLFSIQMGNMSFSNDMAWMSKSGDMDRPGDMNSSGAFPPTNQTPFPPQSQPQPQPPATKFNDISQSTAKQHEGSRVTEQKAAETMREVIMENSIKRDSLSKEDLIPDGRATPSNRRSTSNAHSHQSDGSTKSFAFNVLANGDKPLASNHGEEKSKQQKQPEQQNIRPTPDAAAQNPKSTPNAPQNKSWFSCFSCC